MTLAIDNLLVKTGIEAAELNQIKSRPFLYAGIILATTLALTFFGLAISAWL